MITCAKCQLDQPSSEYSPSALKKRSPWCRACRSSYNRCWYDENKENHKRNKRNALKDAAASRARKQALLCELKARPCADCGQAFPSECMDFDHVRGTKTGIVSQLVGCSLARLLDEVEKCDVVCANCHRIRTARRREARP